MRLADFAHKIFNREKLFKAKGLEGISSIEDFYRALERERSRANRSGMPFALVSFQAKNARLNGNYAGYLAKAICDRMRTTDEVGWIDQQHIGLILYNTGEKGAWGFVEAINTAVSNEIDQPQCKVYIYPAESSDSGEAKSEKQNNKTEDASRSSGHEKKDAVSSSAEVSTEHHSYGKELHALEQKHGHSVDDINPLLTKKMPVWKRLLDIFGATLGLIIFSPLFLLSALVIKGVSPGPIFFRQKRIGYGGKEFIFLKFRTMKVNADPTAHQQYYAHLINGDKDAEKPMLKLDERNDQIIPCGNILRKTYLDELPQLINVLRGEMSLVGPRPAIAYEVAEYLNWHDGRFDILPGMTGLWQVSGKNRLTFKEMVRLDISYARNLSFFSDIKILIKTPFAIILEIMGNR